MGHHVLVEPVVVVREQLVLFTQLTVVEFFLVLLVSLLGFLFPENLPDFVVNCINEKLLTPISSILS
jgi:hypothetical protein